MKFSMNASRSRLLRAIAVMSVAGARRRAGVSWRPLPALALSIACLGLTASGCGNGTTSSGDGAANGGGTISSSSRGTTAGPANGSGSSSAKATSAGGSSTMVGGSSSSAAGGARDAGSAGPDGSTDAGSPDASGGAGDGGAAPSSGCGKTPTLWGPDQGTAVMANWPGAQGVPAGRYTQHTITSGGTSRTYYIQAPSNYDKSHPYRLVLAYHWFTGAAIEVIDCHSEGIDCYTTQSPFFGLWALADSSTIFVAADGTPAPTVQPAATANNKGSPKVTGSSAGWGNTNGQDVALTTAILNAVENDLCIDTSRIFANGFSFGGAMSYELSCDPTTAVLLRGVAIYSGSPVLSGCTGETPKMPVAAFLSHGTQDPTNMFAWGQQMRDALAKDNGCTAPSPPLSGTVDMAAPGTHQCYSYQGCSAGHPVEWCAFGRQMGCTGGDHSPSPCDQGATKTWNPQEVWKFISQF